MNRKEMTRKILVYAGYILFFTSIQMTLVNLFSFRGQSMDFMLIFVILTGYLYGSTDGMVIGVIVGLIRDYFSGTTTGVGMLIFLYVGGLASSLFRMRFHRRTTLALLQVGIISFLYKFLGHVFFFIYYLFVSRGTGEYLSQNTIWFYSILPQVLLNLIAAVPMLFLMHKFGPYATKTIRKKEEQKGGKVESWLTN